MKKSLAVILSVLVAAMPTNIFAAELSEEQIGMIRTNCASIKLQLKNVQKNDAKSRVHLGAQFETISSSLMMNLNLRLIKNNMPTSDISSQQAEFSTERERFKSDYITYAKELDNLISINCHEKPEEFYNRLSDVRTKRQIVADDVARLLEIAKKHRSSVLDLRKSLEKSEGK